MNTLQYHSSANEPTIIRIERLAYGGKGIGFHQGKAIFVSDTVPGDLVQVSLEKEKKRYANARLLSLLEASKMRQEAPCPFFSRCGGCHWQMISPDQQLQWKKKFVKDALQRIGKLEQLPNIVMYPAPSVFYHRNRIQLKGRYHQNGKISIGYFQQGSHDLVEIDHCLVAQEPINSLIKHLASSQLARIPMSQDFRCAVQVVSPQGRDGLLVELEAAPGKNPILNSLPTIKARLEEMELPTHVNIFNSPQQEFWPYDMQDGIVYWTASGQFQQIHLSGNHLLRKYVRQLCHQYQAQSILDLFCGSGNLSIQLAALDNCQVVGLEINPIAIRTAKHNLRSNAIKNAIYRQAASHRLSQELQNSKNFDLIIMDPPRSGLEEAIEPILACEAAQLIYVSCDPNTLARDLAHFVEAGYCLDQISCFDFFPHTYHIETVVSLSRR